MKIQEVENHMEYLMSSALHKCENFSDAEDLVQEVFLAALEYKKPVSNVKAWLSSVLNNKYFDLLRRKYKLPTISIDCGAPDISDGISENAEESDRPDPEIVRREVAYLADKYRNVIVCHYLYGEKVQSIADRMGIAKGTVLSRLSYGRQQMKKGFEKMEIYHNNSYSPEKLDISCHGNPGLGGEPFSIAKGDMMKQNILIAAYETPLTCVEIAKGLGIPTAYIEAAVDSLVSSQLMCRHGNKVFTDFIITSAKQKSEAAEKAVDFAGCHFEDIWKCVDKAVKALKSLHWYSKMASDMKGKCKYFYILELFSGGIYNALRVLLPFEKEVFPLRPDGGEWIAVGYRSSIGFDLQSSKFHEYSYGGARRIEHANMFSSKNIGLEIYDTQPDLNKYQHGPVDMSDETLCVLLYLLHAGIPENAVAFDPIYLQNIPHLAECGVLRYENNRPVVNIPVIDKNQYNQLINLCVTHMFELRDVLAELLCKKLQNFKTPIPSHLEGRIMEHRRYDLPLTMAVIKEAIKRGLFDNDAKIRPPMVMVIEES